MKGKKPSFYLQLIISSLSIFLSAMSLTSCATPTTRGVTVTAAETAEEAKKERLIALEAWVEDYERLSDVSFRLFVNSAPLCGERTSFRIGILAFNKFAFPEDQQEAANMRYGINDDFRILHVTPGSPADLAGFKRQDLIKAVGAARIPENEDAMEEFTNKISAGADGHSRTAVEVTRHGIDEFLYVVPLRACNYEVLLINSDQINAWADGEHVIITRGLMRYTKDDTQLALVVAHELAHNVMGHIKAKKRNAALGSIFDLLAAVAFRVNTGGTFRNIGALSYSKAFEAEADYVGLYLVARAGYDINEAPNFWRLMAAADPRSIGYSKTHPSSPERFIAMEKTVQEIRGKIATGMPLRPEMKKKKDKSEQKDDNNAAGT
jgi:hypothetical protein